MKPFESEQQRAINNPEERERNELKRYYIQIDSEYDIIERYPLLLNDYELEEFLDDVYKLKEKYRKKGLEK